MELSIPTARIDGVQVSCLGFRDTVALVARWLDVGRGRRIATANLDFLRLAAHDAEFRFALATCDLVTADGWPVVLLARRGAGRSPNPDAVRPKERVAGSDLVPALAAECARLGRSVYLLGGHPGTGEGAAARLVAANPGLRIAGTSSVRVDMDDVAACAAVAAAIRATGADLLLVGLGAPKQDRFLADWIHATGVRVGIGVGGTFDFLSGRIARAPRPVRAVGMEWLWRLLREPRRLTTRYLAAAAHLVRLLGPETTRRRPRPAVARS